MPRKPSKPTRKPKKKGPSQNEVRTFLNLLKERRSGE